MLRFPARTQSPETLAVIFRPAHKIANTKKMNKILLLLNIVLLSSCNGQTNNVTENYSQKVEYGLKGNVKEMKKYVCKVENNKIPLDTTNFFRSYIKTFDEDGNSIEYNFSNKNEKNTIYIKMIFSGKSKDISYKEIVSFDKQKKEEKEYKYVWLNDFTYKIVDINDENYSQTQTIKLNKEFSIIEDNFKQGDYESLEKREIIAKNNKIEKIKSTITTKTDDKTDISYHIEVVKKYDKYDNPTIIYIYNTLDEKQLSDVVFQEYIYY